jgi:hypothetical protein
LHSREAVRILTWRSARKSEKKRFHIARNESKEFSVENTDDFAMLKSVFLQRIEKLIR